MTFATLRALHALIGAALDDIDAVYQGTIDAPLSPLPRIQTHAYSYPYSPSPTTSYSPSPYSPREAEGDNDTGKCGEGQVETETRPERKTWEGSYPSPAPLSPAHMRANADRENKSEREREQDPGAIPEPGPEPRDGAYSLSSPYAYGSSTDPSLYLRAQVPRQTSPAPSSCSSYSSTTTPASSRASSKVHLNPQDVYPNQRPSLSANTPTPTPTQTPMNTPLHRLRLRRISTTLSSVALSMATPARLLRHAASLSPALEPVSGYHHPGGVEQDAAPTSPITFAESHFTGDEDGDGWGDKREPAVADPDSSVFAHDLQRTPQRAPHPPPTPTTPTTAPTTQIDLASTPVRRVRWPLATRAPTTPASLLSPETPTAASAKTSAARDGKGGNIRISTAETDSPSPIRFAPNPHPHPDAPPDDPHLKESPETPRKAGEDHEGEQSAKRKKRPAPLLPALTPTVRTGRAHAQGPGQGQAPPTPASLFSLSSPELRLRGRGGTDSEEAEEAAVLGAAWDGEVRKGSGLGGGSREAREGGMSGRRVLDWPALDEPAYVPRTGRAGAGSAPHSPVKAQFAATAGAIGSRGVLPGGVSAGAGQQQTGETGKEREKMEEANAEAEARERAEALTTHPVVLAAVARLVAACGQLCASVQRPFLTVCDAAMGYHLPACLRLLEAAHIPEILHEAGSRGMHVEEIAKRVGALRRAQSRRQVETQDDEGGDSDLEVDPALLGHVLRLLATHHITREVRPNVFANNRISDAIGSGKSIHELAIAPETKYEGTDGIAAFVGLCTDELFKSAAYLTDCYLPPLETPANVSERNGSDSPSSGSGSHADLADLALGRQLGNSIPSPLANVSVSEPLDGNAAAEPSVLLTGGTKQRPRALSSVPVPSSDFPVVRKRIDLGGRRRPRAMSAVPVRESTSNARGPKVDAKPSRAVEELEQALSSHTNGADGRDERESPTGNGQTKGNGTRAKTHPMYAPFNLAFRTQAPYFEWLETKENAARFRRFGKAMTGTGAWEVPGAIVGGFPWHTLPPSSLVVDVGGGIGSTSMILAHTFPHLRFLVQDRAQVVKMGEVAWRDRCPEILDSGRAAFQAHDFFMPQPPWPSTLVGVQKDIQDEREPQPSAAVYLLRVITHDWPDAYVTRILLHLRRAAGPDTKLVLADYVLPLACIDEDEGSDSLGDELAEAKMRPDPLPGTLRSLAPEGSHLLPNLGKANANAYWLDLTMRSTFNAQERTLRELSALALTAGWRIVQVMRSESSLFGHITAVPVDIPPESLVLLDSPLPGSMTASPGQDEDVETPEKVKSPKMGDTFCSFVDLPSEEAVRKSVRAGKKIAGATQGWQARASEWKQRLVKKSSAIWKDRKSPAVSPSAAPPIPSVELLPALDVENAVRRPNKGKGTSRVDITGQAGSPRGLRKVLSRAQLSGGGPDRQRHGVERTIRGGK